MSDDAVMDQPLRCNAERDALAAQGVRERELLQQMTAERDDLRAAYEEQRRTNVALTNDRQALEDRCDALEALVREARDLRQWCLRDQYAGLGWYSVSEARIDNLVSHARALLGEKGGE